MSTLDWDKIFARMDAWWEGEVVDRCVIAITAPKSSAEADTRLPAWLDVDYRLTWAEAEFARTAYLGEAIPVFWCNLGPGAVAGYLGGKPVMAEDTVWFDRYPIIYDWSSPPQIAYDPDNAYWQKTLELTRAAVRRSKHRFFPGITDLGGNLDIVASLRGIEKLLYDLVDSPEAVKRFAATVNALWFRYFDELDGIIREQYTGTATWMNIWCRKRWFPLQCDFSAMISPEMFAEFVLPGLKEQCQRLDYAIYHWDGPGEISHLDLLLSIPELTGIQWTPGYGNEPVESEKWFPLYKRIQRAGKNLVLLGVAPKGVEKILSELSCRGLYMSTHCESEEEAQSLLRQVAKWSRD